VHAGQTLLLQVFLPFFTAFHFPDDRFLAVETLADVGGAVESVLLLVLELGADAVIRTRQRTGVRKRNQAGRHSHNKGKTAGQTPLAYISEAEKSHKFKEILAAHRAISNSTFG
jgi:hypothetical protein